MATVSFFSSKEVEWADLQVYVAGARVGSKLRGLEYGTKTEMEHLYGEGDEAISIQSGNKSRSGTLTILKGALDAMDRAAVLAGGTDVTDLEFDIVAFYKPAGNRPPQTDTLVGCRITEFNKKLMQNDKKMEIPLPFLFLRLLSV